MPFSAEIFVCVWWVHLVWGGTHHSGAMMFLKKVITFLGTAFTRIIALLDWLGYDHGVGCPRKAPPATPSHPENRVKLAIFVKFGQNFWVCRLGAPHPKIWPKFLGVLGVPWSTPWGTPGVPPRPDFRPLFFHFQIFQQKFQMERDDRNKAPKPIQKVLEIKTTL